MLRFSFFPLSLRLPCRDRTSSWLLALAALLLPGSAWSQMCTFTELRFPAFSLPTHNLASTPVNTVFHTITHKFDIPANATVCDSKMTPGYGWQVVSGDRVTSLTNVYTTTMTDVGIKITWFKAMPYVHFAEPIPFPQAGEGFRRFILPEYSLPVKLEFFKLGENVSGNLSGMIARAIFTSDRGLFEALRLSLSDSLVVVPPKPPAPPTCKPVTDGHQIPLGDVRITQFQGPGSTAGEREFPINLSCRGSSAIGAYVTLTDTTNPANTSQVLSLTKDSKATGIGLQILKDGQALSLGPAPGSHSATWYAGQVEASNDWQAFDIRLRVRYIQVQNLVTGGSANGRMTFTLSYQ